MEGFDGSEQQFAVRFARHRAEAFTVDEFVGNSLAVTICQFGLVVEQVDVGRGAILEQINDILSLGGEMGQIRKPIT